MRIKAIIDKDSKNIHIQDTMKTTYCGLSISTFPVPLDTKSFGRSDDGNLFYNKFNLCIACTEKFRKKYPEEL